jgi:uncharacterized protein YpbB
LPQAVYLENGVKYMHLGLEAALAGKSSGQVFQHASLIQNARLYTNSPPYVPKSNQSLPKCLAKIKPSKINQ